MSTRNTLFISLFPARNPVGKSIFKTQTPQSLFVLAWGPSEDTYRSPLRDTPLQMQVTRT